MANISDEVAAQREREHVENHLRSLEQQGLDALLRIEEILARAFPDPRKELKADAADLVVSKPNGAVNVKKSKRGDYL